MGMIYYNLNGYCLVMQDYDIVSLILGEPLCLQNLVKSKRLLIIR